VIIHSPDVEQLMTDFTSLFTVVEAAGGLVENDKNQFLFIYRRKFWDLPKGKFEKNETRKETAVREVQEETGVKGIKLKSKIATTYHVFKTKTGKKILKKSYWFHMKVRDQKLKPQKEEDIEKAE